MSHKPLCTAALLDAPELDAFFIRIAQTNLAQILEQCNVPQVRWFMEMLEPLLRISMLWYSGGCTPGTRMLGLRLESRTNATTPVIARRKRQWQLCLWILYSCIIPQLYKLLRNYYLVRKLQALSQEENDRNSQNVDGERRQRVLLARRRKKLVLSLLLRLCDGVIPLASFCGLISCWTGYTATSMPSMILAGLCFHDTGNDDNNDDSAEGTAGSSTVPLLQVEYAHRRWLQREILATAQILLAGLWVMPRIWNPLIQEWFLQPCWRQLKTITHHVVASTKERCISTNDSNANIPNTAACPRCQRHPICIPFQTSCGHCYCYHCLYLESIQGGDHPEPVYCRICSSIIHSARPWQAD